MSYTEINMGTLHPVLESEFFEKTEGMDKWDREDFLIDNNYIEIDGCWYQIIYKTRGNADLDFAEFFTYEDGSIDFVTCHYNGGAHVTEVLKDALEEKKQ